MPLRHPDAFVDPTEQRKDRGNNPFFTELCAQRKERTLPLVFGQDLREMAGKWRQRIPNTHGTQSERPPLILEIGCYKGETLTRMMREEPAAQYIGVDITYKRVILTAQRMVQEKAEQGVCALAHMSPSTFRQLFGENELDLICIFFPDPWLKSRQEHNRLMQPEFCAELKRALTPGGQVWFKTDQGPYFEQATAALESADLKKCNELKLLNNFETQTPFERRFAEQGLKPWVGIWEK